MMANLSMHLLDIASNSVRANASKITIHFHDSISEDIIFIEITDNGKGMDEKMVKDVQNPFFTTRTTRRIWFYKSHSSKSWLNNVKANLN